MEFTITCPVDGSIEVGLEDVDTVVLRDAEHADMTFVCPHCGSSITVGAVVPAFLLAAMRALAEDPSAPSELRSLVVVSGRDPEHSVEPHDDARVDAYCEYFRRQLDHVVGVEDVLAEIDSGA